MTTDQSSQPARTPEEGALVTVEGAVDALLQSSPAPNYEENDFAAGYVEGLTSAKRLLRAAIRQAIPVPPLDRAKALKAAEEGLVEYRRRRSERYRGANAVAMADEHDTWIAGYGTEVEAIVDAVLGLVRPAPAQTIDRDAAAEAMALVDDYDGCFERIREWEALPQWERDAHPDERPHSEHEDREVWRKRADAVLALLQPADGVRLTLEEAHLAAEALRHQSMHHPEGPAHDWGVRRFALATWLEAAS